MNKLKSHYHSDTMLNRGSNIGYSMAIDKNQLPDRTSKLETLFRDLDREVCPHSRMTIELHNEYIHPLTRSLQQRSLQCIRPSHAELSNISICYANGQLHTNNPLPI